MLSGCGLGGDVFASYDLPESPDVADAPWPRLADAPAAIAPGTYTAAAPDPAVGEAVVQDLTAEAAAAAARAAEAGKPLMDPAEAALLREPRTR